MASRLKTQIEDFERGDVVIILEPGRYFLIGSQFQLAEPLLVTPVEDDDADDS